MLGPVIFTFTGSGNVSQGAQDVFKVLPHEYVSPEDLKDVLMNGGMYSIYLPLTQSLIHTNTHTHKHTLLLSVSLSLSLSFSLSDSRKVYGTEVRRRHHLYRKSDGTYSTPDYVSNPEQYASNFAEKVIIALKTCLHYWINLLH